MTATTAERRGIRVLVVDDHPAVRQGVAQLLAVAGHVMAGEAENHEEALSLLREGGIELALLDLSLAESSGFGLLAGLNERDVPVVVYSMHEDPETIERAVLLGALGYVTKREKPKVLLTALAEVMAGRRFLSPRAEQALAERPCRTAPVDAAQGLSEREREILQLLSRGDTRQDIAAALNIGGRTVETHCKRMIAKLGLGDMKALRKHAISFQRKP